MRRSPWDKARTSARAATAATQCPYHGANWRTYWRRELIKTQQLKLFESNTPTGENETK